MAHTTVIVLKTWRLVVLVQDAVQACHMYWKNIQTEELYLKMYTPGRDTEMFKGKQGCNAQMIFFFFFFFQKIP